MLFKVVFCFMCLSPLITNPALSNADGVVIRTGDLRITENGSGIVFPDGSVQYKAASNSKLTLAAICAAISAGGVPLPSFCINTTPIANAGTSQVVTTGTVVTLDGSASSDANGDSLTYGWSLASKPILSNAVLSSNSVIRPTFTPDVAGSYVFSLIVNDGITSSIANSVTVIVTVPTNTNYSNTYLLKGTWTFSYTIGTLPFSNTYALNLMDTSPNASGDYLISGADIYGDYVNGSYYSATGDWTVFDPGTIIDRFFDFKTNGSTVVTGCYYQIVHPAETWSACYNLSGTKSVSTSLAKTVAKSVGKLEIETIEVQGSESFGYSIPSDAVKDKYLKLRSGNQ
jgi:hypothetical protein